MRNEIAFRHAKWRSVLLVCSVAIISLVQLVQTEKSFAADAAEIDFGRQIRPLLAKKCYSCHGPDTQESGVALHSFDDATRKSESDVSPIVPGNAGLSEMIKRITSDDPSLRMPPEGEGFSENQIKLLKSWIDSGAEYKDHWAFLPLSNPEVPVVAGKSELANPIDLFIAQQWLKRDLKPTHRASPASLVRRLYFDVLGVPPDLEDVQQFESDPSETAYEALVDKLLADPRFGERMARDWLDVVRYAETNSYERDGPKPNAWKYRDYVIKSFNDDKPYDRFLIEQLSGDEIEDRNAESLTGTGFYRLGIWDDEPADRLQARFDEYDDLVTTIGQGFMGLTLNCARCHDHKIDPIPQKDYYQLVAFLRDVTSYGGRGDQRTFNQIDVSDESLKREHIALKESIQKHQEEMRSIENKGIEKMPAEDQLAGKGPDRDKVIREKLKAHLDEADWNAYTTHRKELESDRKRIEQLPLDNRLGLAKCDANPEQTFVLMRGSPQAQGDPVEPGFPKIFGEEKPTIEPSPGTGTAGRRKVFAKWLTSPTNRLTSRVIVNRVWQHHFGRGIVRSANNFGQMGDPPTHPELLDFLANDLVRNGWRLKSLHKLMLMSETYRLASVADEASVAKDPANDYFSRFNPRRLSAEEIRDATLKITGKIDWRIYGPSVFPDVSDAVKAGQSVPGQGWQQSSEADKSRRSVYIHIKRSLIPPELSVFDFPETDTSCEARFLTTQASQALNMLNGAFMQQQSTYFAKRVEQQCASVSDPAARLPSMVRAAIEAAYCRPATNDEIKRAQARVSTLQSKFGMNEQQAFREYCLVLLNSNEYMYVD